MFSQTLSVLQLGDLVFAHPWSMAQSEFVECCDGRGPKCSGTTCFTGVVSGVGFRFLHGGWAFLVASAGVSCLVGKALPELANPGVFQGLGEERLAFVCDHYATA